ncbi:MAG: ABC transporter ATP-binding protein [Lachnospiraceae bacterium]|nr:ABC transporter ATP-binding protein [Lachnospiraceae bacterium]
MASVTLKHIGKIYGRNVEAVKDLNLEIKDGEFLCILGPSGCGKSTTMRMVAGLEKITSGDMYIGDQRVNDMSPSERDIAMSFENYALYPDMTIYQNIAFPLEIRKVPKDEIHKKVLDVANLLGIQGMLDQVAKDLSGGVQQRVSVARALVRNPKVLILDEPISHLEEELKAKMREELRRLLHNLHITTLYVTHDQIEAMVMADRIAVMKKSLLQQVDTPDRIYSHPANMFVAGFIGEPPMNFVKCAFDAERSTIEFDGIVVPVDAKTTKKLAEKGVTNVVIGIRDTHINISKKPAEGLVEAKIFYIEPRNEEMIYTLEIGSYHLLATAKADYSAQIGDKVYISFDYSRCNFFDIETENNLFAGE